MATKMSDEDFDKLLKEALPVIDAMDAPPSPPPPEVLQRLEADRLKLVQESKRSISTPEPKPNSVIEFFQWLFSAPRLAPVCVACSLLVILAVGLTITFFPGRGPVIQLAMLDTIGGTRGSTSGLVTVIQQTWNQTKVEPFSASAELKRWLETWPADDQKPVVKVIYDRDAGDVRVVGRIKGKPPFEKTFPVQQEQDLRIVLKVAQAFIEEQLR